PALGVSLVAVALAALSPLWNVDLGGQGYFAHLFVAFCSALLALGAGRLRDQVVDQLGRQQMLSAVADLPAPGATLDPTAGRGNEVLLPGHAGFAAVEADLAGARHLLGTRGTEPVVASETIVTPLR